MKKSVMISVDEFSHSKAKDKLINISEICENAIREVVDSKPQEIICSQCGCKEEQASKDNNYTGMTWLCPDEVWICSRCLRKEINKVIIGVVPT